MSKAALVLGLALLQTSAASSMDQATAAADRLLDSLRAFSRVPGHAASVVVDGEVVWSGVTGLANLDTGAPVSADSRFRLASVSKLYTAALLLKLAEEGRIDLDSDVSSYVTDWPPRSEGEITPRRLAAHTSGVPHYGSPGTSRPGAQVRVANPSESLGFFRDAPLLHPPGRAYAYSSYGYALLAAAAASVGGKPFPQLLSDEILRPHGLRETGVEDVTALSEAAVQLYSTEGPDTVALSPNDQSYVWGATGMRASARDVARFGHEFAAGSIVSRSSVEEALTPVLLTDGAPTGNARFQVGFGWRTGRDWNARSVAHHAGSTPGARSVLVVYPNERVAVSLLSNATWTSRVETTAELLAAPFFGPAREGPFECPNGVYAVEGSFDGEPETGTLQLTADGLLCTATITSAGALARKFSNGTFPAVRVVASPGEQVFAVAYPWGLAALRVRLVGKAISISGDFAGREIDARGELLAAPAPLEE